MATRNVSIKLAILGESEYRSKIASINSELKMMQSALKLTESQFSGQANSMAALTAKGNDLQNAYAVQKRKVEELQAALQNAQKAVDAYKTAHDGLEAKLAENAAAQKKLEDSTGDTSAEMAKLKKEEDELNKALQENKAYTAAAEKGVTNWKTKLNNASVELNKLDAEIKQNNKYLDEAKSSADGCATSIDRFGKEIKQSGDSAKTSADAIEALAATLLASGLKRGLEEIADALTACVNSSVDFESAMAGVAKTTDMSDNDLAAMGEEIKKLSTEIPITATELAGIVEVAGQLGIEKENLVDFATVMANLGVATNMTSEEAATMLARFANVTGMAPENYERLGSAIVALGNSFATTEGEITHMSQRLAASGKIVGLTEPEILALATAMSSVGIEAEAGGTAMSQTLTQIGKYVETGGEKLETLAKVAGMTSDEFSSTWKDKPIDAIESFIRGLGNLDEEAESTNQILDDLGMKGVRQSNMLKSLGLASDVLSGAINTANTAWGENTALIREASTRYATTESKFQLFKNSVDNLKIAVGDQLTPALGNLAETGADVTNWAADFVAQNEWLAPAISAVTVGLGVMTTAVLGFVAVVKVAIPAIAALKAVLATASGGTLLIVAAIVSAVAALGALVATMPKADREFDGLTESSKRQYRELEKLNDEYEKACALYGENSREAQRLKAQVDEATESFDKNKRSVEDMNASHQKAIDTQRELADAHRETIKGIESEQEYYTGLVAKLESLMAVENKTAATKTEILGVVDLLNDAVPELGVAYDQYADSLNLTAEGIRAVIEAEIARERYHANYDALKAAIVNEQELKQVYTESIAETAAAKGRLADAQKEYNDKAKELGDPAGEAGYREWAAKMAPYAKEVTKAEEAVKSATQAEEAAQSAHEASTQRVNELTESMTGLAEAAEESANVASRATESIKPELKKLAQSYKDAYDAALKSLDGQIGLWGKCDSSAITSAQTLQDAVDSQIGYLSNYQDNMNSLLSRNIEGIQNFAKNFTDGSAESAAALAGLATASDEEIGKIIESMAQTDKLKESLASTFSALETDLSDSIASLASKYEQSMRDIEGITGDIDFTPFMEAVSSAFGDVGVSFENIGIDASEGLAVGLESGIETVSDSASTIAQTLVGKLSESIGESSMSEVGGVIAENLSQSISESITESIGGALEGALETVATTSPEIIATVTDMGLQAATGFQTELGGMSEATTQELSNVNQALASNVPTAYSGGYDIGAAISQGAKAGVMAYAAQVAAEAAEMVRNAIAAARAAAAVNSPSKKMITLGHSLDEGLIVGIKDMEKDVIRTIEDTMVKITEVQVEMPDIPNKTDAVLRAIGIGADDNKVVDAINRLGNSKKETPQVIVNQTINAENTSYVGQQREAARQMRKLARELNR